MSEQDSHLRSAWAAVSKDQSDRDQQAETDRKVFESRVKQTTGDMAYRPGLTAANYLDRATEYVRMAVAGNRFTPEELQEVAEAFAEFRTELDRAREAVLPKGEGR